MIPCIIIGLITGGIIALLLYLYEEYVDELKQEIRELKIKVEELDKTAETYGSIIDDEQHYYDKWMDAKTENEELKFERDQLENQLAQLEDQLAQAEDFIYRYRE